MAIQANDATINYSQALSATLSKIPDTLLSKTRLEIMVELYHMGAIEFTQLKKDLNLSDGSLAAHLKKLEECEYVIPSKVQEPPGSRERTGILITPKGMRELETLLAEFQALKELLQKAKRTE